VDLTFLTRAEGGRRGPVEFGTDVPKYVPHLVVTDGGRDVGDYLGVRFLDGPAEYVAGVPGRFVCELAHHPHVDYSGLRPGTTIAVREGPNTVAYGTVCGQAPDHAVAADPRCRQPSDKHSCSQETP
jgi:hypothetical protein